MNKIERPVLRYHGGKFLLAPWIISHFPAHKVYTEVFGGAASVLMQKPRSYAEVYNDKWDTVVNVFQVLRDPESAKRLEQLLYLTPFSRTEFEQCGEIDLVEIANPIERARLTIFRSFAGFGSASTNAKHSTGFRKKTSNSRTVPAIDWMNFPQYIESFTERLRGVVIEHRDYKEVILQHDSVDTLHYLDPPYPHITRNMARGNSTYAHDIDDSVHVEMAGLLENIKGMAIISGYKCDLYDELFRNWHRVEKSAFADGARLRVECLWINDRAFARAPKKELFAC